METPHLKEAMVEAPRTNRQARPTTQSKIGFHPKAFKILLSKVFVEQSTPCSMPTRSSMQIAIVAISMIAFRAAPTPTWEGIAWPA
jgi:hypothetical protein